MCPDCLVDLVDDPDASLRCRHCGRDWPATMVSCPNCLAELRPDPEAALEAMGRILAMGGHLPRAAGTAPFADGPACTLLRLAGRGPLVYIGSDGFELVETGGGSLAAMGRSDHEIDGWIDDQWWLQPAGRLPLRRLAAVAMVLAAKVLLGRPWPVRAGADPVEEADDEDRWLLGN